MTDRPNRQATEWQYAARSLSELAGSEDGDLEAFRAGRMDDDTVELEKLRQARDLLDTIVRWIQSPNADNWRLLSSAHAALADAPAPTTEQTDDDQGAETASLNISSARELRTKIVLPFTGDTKPPESVEDEYPPKDTGTVHLSDNAASRLRDKIGAPNKK